MISTIYHIYNTEEEMFYQDQVNPEDTERYPAPPYENPSKRRENNSEEVANSSPRPNQDEEDWEDEDLDDMIDDNPLEDFID